MAKCESEYVTNVKGCYDSCTSHVCPGDSCVNSGCGYGHCPCDNANATSCCQWCGSGVLPQYFSCRNYYDRAVEYCMKDCQNTCYKNCSSDGQKTPTPPPPVLPAPMPTPTPTPVPAPMPTPTPASLAPSLTQGA
jgi:hypothetical protein